MSRFHADDRLQHDISGMRHARESFVWATPLPAEGLVWFVYLWTLGDTGRWARFIGIGGEDYREPVFVDFADDLVLEGDGLHDCTIGGLRLRQPDEIGNAELTYTSNECSFELRTRGRHEPYSWHQAPGGCPQWAAKERYEQTVHSEGSLQIGSRTVEFSGFGHIDHSWGTRDWRALQHWKWVNVGNDTTSLHLWESYALGERQVNGYVNRNGEVSVVHDLAITPKLDDALVQRGLTALVTDEHGRETSLEFTEAATWRMPIGHHYLTEVAGEAVIDGAPGTGISEFGFPQNYVDAYDKG